MARRGRPKKPGPRHPGGQLKAETAGVTGTALQRLRALGRNPLLETQVGRLLFLDELRPIDAQTAFRIAEIYGRYERAIGRRRSAASPSYERGRGRDDGGIESDAQQARSESAARQFGMLQAEIALCPRGVKAALEELCVEDKACPPGWLPAVKIALDMLAVPLGIRRMRRGERPKGEVKHSAQFNENVNPIKRTQAEFEAFAAVLHVDLNEDDGRRVAAARSLFASFKALQERAKFRADKDRLTPPNRKK